MRGKVALFVMTYQGFEILKAVTDNGLSDLIQYVVIGKDKNTLNDYSDEMKAICLKNNIPSFYKDEKIPPHPEFIITIAWRWLIQCPDSRLIVFHHSLLPKYRGFAPLVNQLINGDTRIGVTAIFGEEEYDVGDIIAQESVGISYPIKIQDAIERISPLFQNLMLNILGQIRQHGKIITARKQDPAEVSYSLWRDDEDYRIDWKESAEYITRFIHAVGFPYKGALAELNGQPIRILEAIPLPDVYIEIRHIGKVIFMKNNRPVVVCGKGLLHIQEAHIEGSEESIFPLKKFRSRFN